MTPVLSDRIFGHVAARTTFAEAHASGRLHHAWLLSGTGQIGKRTLALAFARSLLKADDPLSGAARRIAAGTHRDLLMVKSGKSTAKDVEGGAIVVADIKPIQQLLHHTAAEGGWRVVIIEGGDRLNNFAGNAILKLLEEPPEKTVFFIIADNETAVLPTIRSRCHRVRLHPLNDDQMADVLDAIGITEPARRRDIITRAKGRPGFAIQLGAQADDPAAQLVDRIIREGSASLKPDQADGVVREEKGFAGFCDLLQEHLRSAALQRIREKDVHAASRAAEAYQGLIRIRHETERFNLDKTQAALMAASLLDRL